MIDVLAFRFIRHSTFELKLSDLFSFCIPRLGLQNISQKLNLDVSSLPRVHLKTGIRPKELCLFLQLFPDGTVNNGDVRGLFYKIQSAIIDEVLNTTIKRNLFLLPTSVKSYNFLLHQMLVT
jgi:hypothetical protein